MLNMPNNCQCLLKFVQLQLELLHELSNTCVLFVTLWSAFIKVKVLGLCPYCGAC